MPRTSRKRSEDARDAGYSLIEILIVLTIMALLATLVAPRLLGQVDRSRVTTASAQIAAIETALDTLVLDYGRYPNESEGLALLVAPPQDPAMSARWFGPYMDGPLPLDPWGSPYQYQAPAAGGQTQRRATVYSYGADGAPGGEGLDADINAPQDGGRGT